MKILVAGGAGYIGSHTVKSLLREGYEVAVFDDFSTGRREFVPANASIIKGDLMDGTSVRKAFASNEFGAVLHFASLIQVGESCLNPIKYYRHNLGTAMNLLEGMLEAGVKRFIFSSSAAVYGEPRSLPIMEDHPISPCNPYGMTKAFVERILQDYDRAYGLKFISLRYFNASGADPDGGLGEVHNPETHLIPNLLLSLLGKNPDFAVFGSDFPTPDGTAIRDYIHVSDLASAHALALRALLDGTPSEFINLGTNRGTSVLEIIRTAEEVTGLKAEYKTLPRREGDVPVLLASKEKAEKLLNWKLRHSDIRTIIRTAWAWHRKNS